MSNVTFADALLILLISVLIGGILFMVSRSKKKVSPSAEKASSVDGENN